MEDKKIWHRGRPACALELTVELLVELSRGRLAARSQNHLTRQRFRIGEGRHQQGSITLPEVRVVAASHLGECQSYKLFACITDRQLRREHRVVAAVLRRVRAIANH